MMSFFFSNIKLVLNFAHAWVLLCKNTTKSHSLTSAQNAGPRGTSEQSSVGEGLRCARLAQSTAGGCARVQTACLQMPDWEGILCSHLKLQVGQACARAHIRGQVCFHSE